MWGSIYVIERERERDRAREREKREEKKDANVRSVYVQRPEDASRGQ